MSPSPLPRLWLSFLRPFLTDYSTDCFAKRRNPPAQPFFCLYAASLSLSLSHTKPLQHPPTRRGIIVDVMVESADKFVDFMGKTTKAKV